MMRVSRLMGIMATVALSGSLIACGQVDGKLSIDALEDVSGVKVVAENAGTDQSAKSAGAIEIEDGDALVISPFIEKGHLHLTVTSGDGDTVAYDDDVDGRVMFQVDAEPGDYDVKVVGGGDTTGWMTVFSQDEDEMAKQDASLKDTLEENGVDSDVVEDIKAEAEKKGDK